MPGVNYVTHFNLIDTGQGIARLKRGAAIDRGSTATRCLLSQMGCHAADPQDGLKLLGVIALVGHTWFSGAHP